MNSKPGIILISIAHTPHGWVITRNANGVSLRAFRTCRYADRGQAEIAAKDYATRKGLAHAIPAPRARDPKDRSLAS